MLKIIKSTEAIEIKTIVMVLYSPPGYGKTSTGSTANKPLLLDFDNGSHRSRNRRDVVRVESWKDVTQITGEDLKPYSTLVVDTAGRALDVLTPSIIEADPKAGRGGGALTQNGYGKLKSEFIAWLKFVRSFGLDVVLIAHSDEQKNGDDTIERLDVQGGSKGEIYKSADAMGRISLKNGKRILNFSPTDTAFGKNPAGLPPIEIPDFAGSPDFLAGVIQQTKDAINALTTEQAEVAKLLGEWQERIATAKTADEFNALLPECKTADERVRENLRRIISQAAKANGCAIDKAAGVFVQAAPAAGAAPAEGKAPTATTSPAASATGPVDGGTLPTAASAPPADREVGADDGDETPAVPTGDLPGIVVEAPKGNGKKSRKAAAA